MTTTIKVHIGGNFQRDVRIEDTKPVTVGPNEERSFLVPHGDAPFVVELSAERVPAKPEEPTK